VTDGLITQLQLQINMEDHWQLLTRATNKTEYSCPAILLK